MLIGIDKNEVKEFISVVDKDSEKPTIFLIGNISNAQKMAMIGTVIMQDGKVDNKTLQAKAPEILKMGLKGIKNLYSSSKKVPIDITEITDDVIDSIPFQVLYEVVGEIVKYNFEMGEVRKN